MMSNTLLSTAISVRQMVVQLAQSIPEELFDVQPRQFNNTIRWNVGHIAFVNEYFLSLGLPIISSLPDHYTQLFNTGTLPTEWASVAPAKEELCHHLTSQLADFSKIPPTAFDQPLTSPLELGPLKFETFGEVFNFATVHEMMHYTTISCYLKVLQYQTV